MKFGGPGLPFSWMVEVFRGRDVRQQKESDELYFGLEFAGAGWRRVWHLRELGQIPIWKRPAAGGVACVAGDELPESSCVEGEARGT